LAEPTQHIAPKGQFNYLSLDIVNSFRDVLKEQGDSKLKTEYKYSVSIETLKMLIEK